MGLPECKAGSDWQVQNREQKEEEKEELKYVRAGVCKPWRPLKLSLRNQVWCGEENRNCVFSGTDANLIKPGAGLAGQKPVRNSWRQAAQGHSP